MSIYIPIFMQFVFVLTMVWIVLRGQERMEAAQHTTDHVLRGLSRALWVDLASRPYSDAATKVQARKIIAEMDASQLPAPPFVAREPL